MIMDKAIEEEIAKLDAETRRLRWRMLSFKNQARNLIRSLEARFTDEEAIAAERRAGGAICPDCQLEYFDHPTIHEGPAEGLTVTCQGNLVKL